MIKGHNKTPNKEALQKQAQDRWKEVKIKDKNVIQNHIFELLHTPIQPSPFPFISQQKPVEESSKPPLIPLDILPEPYDDIQFRSNAVVQRQIYENLQKVKNNLYEYNKLIQAASSPELLSQFNLKIKKLEETITMEEKRLKQLKNNATAQQRARKKRQRKAVEENIVEVYDTPGRPSFLIEDPNLLEKMHNSVEFGAADYKRRKEIIKVRTVKHLHKMEEDYNIYMARSTLQNYMQPRHPGRAPNR